MSVDLNGQMIDARDERIDVRLSKPTEEDGDRQRKQTAALLTLGFTFQKEGPLKDL